jgi:hypothetical protein
MMRSRGVTRKGGRTNRSKMIRRRGRMINENEREDDKK